MALTTTGKTLIAARLAGTSAAAIDTSTGYLGVGTSNTAFDVAQTDLIGTAHRELLDSSTPSSATITLVAAFESADANHAWAEFGVFNHSSAGTMLCRKVADHGTKASGDVWTFTCVLTIA